MRHTGIVRRICHQGVLTLPANYRKSLGIREGDTVQITIEDDQIVVRKNDTGRVFHSCCNQMIDNMSALKPEIRGPVYDRVCEIRKLIREGSVGGDGSKTG